MLPKPPCGLGHGSTATVCTRFFRFGHQPLDGAGSAGVETPGHDLYMFWILIFLARTQNVGASNSGMRDRPDPQLMSYIHPPKATKRHMFGGHNPITTMCNRPCTIFCSKRVNVCKNHGACRSTSDCPFYTSFRASNVRHHNSEVCGPIRAPLWSYIHPSMVTNWYMFGAHTPMYTRVTTNEM